MNDFNERMRKSQMSRGWSNNQHNRWQRTHDNNSPFKEPEDADTFAEALIGVIALAVLFIIVLLLGGGW